MYDIPHHEEWECTYDTPHRHPKNHRRRRCHRDSVLLSRALRSEPPARPFAQLTRRIVDRGQPTLVRIGRETRRVPKSGSTMPGDRDGKALTKISLKSFMVDGHGPEWGGYDHEHFCHL
jgi:hypothetical protein